MVQFFSGLISGVAGSLWSERIKAFVMRLHNDGAPHAPTDHELLERIAKNTDRSAEAATEEYRREITAILTLFQSPFLAYVENYGRNHVFLVSNSNFTLQYEDGSTVPISAGVLADIRKHQRIGLTPGDTSPSRIVTVFLRD